MGNQDITLLLEQAAEGNRESADQVLSLVYNQLRSMAAAKMRNEAAGHTLQPTALVHEVWFKIIGNEEAVSWKNRAHFFAVAAQSMRRVLVDSARARSAQKRGGNNKKFEILDGDLVYERDEDLIALDEALEKFAEVDPLKAKLVELRFFAGCAMPEIAQQLGISLSTAERYWTFARAWLKKRVQE